MYVPSDELGNELQYIYILLRDLNYPFRLKPKRNSPIHVNHTTELYVSLFPSRFLLKLLEEKLILLGSLARDQVKTLFKRINKRAKRDEEKQSEIVLETNFVVTRCLELDEYFHFSLYHLYDYIIDLNWHEPLDFNQLSDSEEYLIRTKLIRLKNFSEFQRDLNRTTYGSNHRSVIAKDSIIETTTTKRPPLKKTNSIKSSLAIRGSNQSSLGVGRLRSPSKRGFVRFQDINSSDTNISMPSTASYRNLKGNHAILALDLLLYALEMFIRCLNEQLLDYISSEVDLNERLTFIKESRQKIRTNQLITISRQIKYSNDVYLTVLEHLSSIKKTYLIDHLIEILCTQDSEIVLSSLIRDHIDTFSQQIEENVERKIITSFAEQCLQILLDLVTSEINLPPIELDTDTRSKSKLEVVKSRQNYLNFISSWLNIDDIVFGTVTTKKRTSKTDNVQENRNNIAQKKAKKTSTLALDSRFKSSSRILAQMDNLGELMSDLLGTIADRLQSAKHQLKYFLETIHLGIDRVFDIISTELLDQLKGATDGGAREVIAPKGENQNLFLVTEDYKALIGAVDLIAAKIRCLKVIHIMTSFDGLIKELCRGNKIQLSDKSLDVKLNDFTNKCIKKNGN